MSTRVRTSTNGNGRITAEPREKWLPLGGLTPLLFAARQGCVDCAQILLKAGAKINAADPDGISSGADRRSSTGTTMPRRSCSTRARIRIWPTDTGRTALFSAVDFNTMPVSNRPSPKVIDNQISSLDLIKSLLDKGANVNAQLKKQQPYRTKLDRGDDTMLTTGTTPLLRAAKAGDIPAMRLLLAKNADPKLATRTGITPLMAAAGLGTERGRHHRPLQDRGGSDRSDPAMPGRRRRHQRRMDRGKPPCTPPRSRAMTRSCSSWRDHGANLDAKDKQGKTPLDSAMGLAGGVGFDGSSSQPHPSTAALIEKLLQK